MKTKGNIREKKSKMTELREWLMNKGNPSIRTCSSLATDGLFTHPDSDLGFINRSAPLNQPNTCRWSCPACGYYHVGSLLDYLEHSHWVKRSVRFAREVSKAGRACL